MVGRPSNYISSRLSDYKAKQGAKGKDKSGKATKTKSENTLPQPEEKIPDDQADSMGAADG